MIVVPAEVARRYVLGAQGLWPGRRWVGESGTDAAMRAMEHLQLDPLQVVARSQDIALHSRVLGYRPGDWENHAYERRQFFDWGGWLAVRPMQELPHWRTMMRRNRDFPRLQADAKAHADAIEEMRRLLRSGAVVSNRDFAMNERSRVHDHYRGRKDSAIALHYLWRTGEAMVHHRERFERAYALTEHVAPAEWLAESGDRAADRFMLLKLVAFHGLMPWRSLTGWVQRPVSAEEAARWRDELLDEGEIIAVRVEGWRDVQYARPGAAAMLGDLAAGRIPPAWTPAGPTAEEEAVFLAPLDIVSARGRAARLFDFEYTWDVYKPAHQRPFGYYTLPVLWGDRLVARVDLRLDRAAATLLVLGFWAETPKLATSPAFRAAFVDGARRFAEFTGAARIGADAVGPASLRRALTSSMRGGQRPHTRSTEPSQRARN